MKDKLEPNMYVRTKRGTFDRFMTSKKNESLTWYTFEDRGSITNPENYIINASHNIIDLIEVGDYVNGKKIVDVGYLINGPRKGTKVIDYYITPSAVSYLENEDIKSVITHEQIEQMEYRIGE